ncbi:HlyD family efflux transporter periplasmic adaptor subunit [Paenibacillus chartarius]|uniref:HlyD family efflux transporter periplasmic adaptor subunit n=1 Tax=Paenibacillus chartarius TaxID=747481 RepID=A0ABV6DED5_9BACL
MAGLRNKKWIAIIALIVVCGGGTAAYVTWKPGTSKPAAGQQQQRVVQVTKGNIKVAVSGTAQFEPRDLQNIIAPADGTIKTMNMTRYQEVKKGQLLFELSSSSQEASLKQAQNQLVTLEQELADLIAQQGRMTITATADGVITLANNLDAGSSVNKNGKIGTISPSGILTVKLLFPAAEGLQAKKGDVVDLSITGHMLTQTGIVESVDKNLKADANGNKLVTVIVNVPNDGTLSAGTMVKGSLSIGASKVEASSEAALEYISTVTLLSEAQGTVKKLNVKTGDTVHAGDVIAELANDTLANSITAKQNDIERQKVLVSDSEDKIKTLQVFAPFDGIFSTDFANKRTNVLNSYPVGATIESGTQLGAVASFNSLQLPIQVDELDLPSIKVGQKANVTVSAIAGRTFEGEVTQISSVGTTTNGVTAYDVVVAVNNNDQIIKNGMTATAEILVQNKTNVLVLPVEALQTQRGQRFVTLQKEDGTLEQQHPIKIGVRSQTQVEVTEGLSEGDKVFIPQSAQRSNLTQAQQDQLRQQFQGGAGGAGAGAGGGSFAPPAGGFGGGGTGGTGGGRAGGN